MENMPLISVIVPVYQVEAYLDRCISSLVGQTYKNLEIILVDDGSPDSCPRMCDIWAERDHRIQVIHKENGGLSDARNAGLAAATGEYLSFVDSDDWLDSHFYQILLETMQQTNSDIVACGIHIFSEDGSGPQAPFDLSVAEYTAEQALDLLIDDVLRQVVWNKLYRRDTIGKIPFAVGKYHEDEFWSYQAIGNASKLSVVQYPGYHYLQRNGSIMGSDYTTKRLDVVEAKCLRQDYLEATYPAQASHGRINLFLTCLYHGQQALRHLSAHDKQQTMHLLKKTMRTHSLRREDIGHLRLDYKIWYWIACLSLDTACMIRNLLGIGV